MKRYLYLVSSQKLCRQLASDFNFRVITSSPQAARTLKVSHYSLEALAEHILRDTTRV